MERVVLVDFHPDSFKIIPGEFMKYFFFRQKRDKLQDKRLVAHPLREFKIEAETETRAIQKLINRPPATNRKVLSQDIIPVELSEPDILELFDIHEYNFAIHGNVPNIEA